MNLLTIRRCNKSVVSLSAFLWFFSMLLNAPKIDAKTSDNLCPDLGSISQPIQIFSDRFSNYTITNISLDWFDFENSEKAPTLFHLLINPALREEAAANRLRLQVYIYADSIAGLSNLGEKVVITDRLSVPIAETDVGRLLTSNEVFGWTFEPGGVKGSESDMVTLTAEGGQLPEMTMFMRFRLTCDDQAYNISLRSKFEANAAEPIAANRGKLRYVKSVRAESPGTQVNNPRPVDIYTITPLFVISSDLYNKDFDYPPNQPKFTLFVHEMFEGETVNEALSGIEYFSVDVYNQFPVKYPEFAPPLQVGKTYVWRVRANLYGPNIAYEWSNPLYFRVSTLLSGEIEAIPDPFGERKELSYLVKYADDYNRRVMAALKIILGENFDIFIGSLDQRSPRKGHIRLNGQPLSVEQLESLAKEFLQDRHTLTRVRFQ